MEPQEHRVSMTNTKNDMCQVRCKERRSWMDYGFWYLMDYQKQHESKKKGHVFNTMNILTWITCDIKKLFGLKLEAMIITNQTCWRFTVPVLRYIGTRCSESGWCLWFLQTFLFWSRPICWIKFNPKIHTESVIMSSNQEPAIVTCIYIYTHFVYIYIHFYLMCMWLCVIQHVCCFHIFTVSRCQQHFWHETILFQDWCQTFPAFSHLQRVPMVRQVRELWDISQLFQFFTKTDFFSNLLGNSCWPLPTSSQKGTSLG